MFVRWGDTCSISFCVTNGVKQGGIISPMLFILYMDDLSLTLNCSGIRGYIGTTLMNHLCYANDLCLISLSSSGMQQLLIFVKNMHLSTSYYIMDQSHLYCVLNKTLSKSVFYHFFLI